MRLGRRMGGLLVLGLLLVPAGAQAQAGTPGFSCRASAVRAPLIGEPAVANNPYTPCKTDAKSVNNSVQSPGLLGVYVLDARTSTEGWSNYLGQPTPGGGAWASVAYAVINLPGLAIKVWGVSSNAGRKCLAPGFTDIGGSSVIAALSINGRFIPVAAPGLAIPLGIGTLYLNYATKNATDVTTRALWLDLAGDANDIVLAEARAGATGNPCAVAR
jgi:hypothetical protein